MTYVGDGSGHGIDQVQNNREKKEPVHNMGLWGSTFRTQVLYRTCIRLRVAFHMHALLARLVRIFGVL